MSPSAISWFICPTGMHAHVDPHEDHGEHQKRHVAVYNITELHFIMWSAIRQFCLLVILDCVSGWVTGVHEWETYWCTQVWSGQMDVWTG